MRGDDPGRRDSVDGARRLRRRGVWRALSGARLSADGRTLTVEFTGAPSGTGPCTADYHLELAQSREAVAVAVREHDHSTNVACSAVGYPRHVTQVLSAPLGARVVVDAANRTAVATSEAAQAG
jgi:hypothetical protein